MVMMTRFALSAAVQLAFCARASECSGDGEFDACSLLQQLNIQHSSGAIDPSMPDRAPEAEGGSEAVANLEVLAQVGATTSVIQSALAMPFREGCQEVLPMLAQATPDELTRVCSAAELPEEACAAALNGMLKAPKPWKQTRLMKACLSLEAVKGREPVVDSYAIESKLIARAMPMRDNPLDGVGDGFNSAGESVGDSASDVSDDFNAHAHGSQGLDRIGAGVRGDAQDLEQSLQFKARSAAGGTTPAPVGSIIEGPFETGLASPVDQVMGWEQPELNETELEADLAADASWEDANWTANWTDNESQGFYLPGGYAEASNWYVPENITADTNLPEEPVAEETAAEEPHALESWELGYDASDDALVNSSIDFGASGPSEVEEEAVADDSATVETTAEGGGADAAADDAPDGSHDPDGADADVADTNSIEETETPAEETTAEVTDTEESEGEVEIPGTSVVLPPPGSR